MVRFHLLLLKINSRRDDETSAAGVWHYTLWDNRADELFAEDYVDLASASHIATLTPEQVAKIAFILEES